MESACGVTQRLTNDLRQLSTVLGLVYDLTRAVVLSHWSAVPVLP